MRHDGLASNRGEQMRLANCSVALVLFGATDTAAHAYSPTTVRLSHLDSLIESYDAEGLIVAGGQATTLDGPTNFTCDDKGGCIVVEALTMQIGGSQDSGNVVSLCVMVDGVPMNSGGCFNNVALLGNQGNYIAVNWRDNVHVKHGKHKLETQVLTTFDAQIGWYQNDYSIYH
jgi:hypothetical protein